MVLTTRRASFLAVLWCSLDTVQGTDKRGLHNLLRLHLWF